MSDDSTQTRYRELFEASPYPMLVYDPSDLKIRFANREAATIYGYPATELCALTIEQLHPPKFRNALRQAIPSRDGGPHYAGTWTHQRADGSTFEVEITSNDLWIHEGWHRMVLVQPVDTRREAILREQRRLQRTSRQERALAQLATDPVLGSGERIEHALARICRTATDALSVNKAGFWRLHQQPPGLTCECLYDTAAGFSAGHHIDGTRCPAYLDAVGNGRTIDAADAVNDPRTRELTEDYLAPEGVGAMLDSAVRLHGRVYGVLCLEHMGQSREWLADEIRFAGELADQATQALMNAERERHKQLLHTIASGVATGTGRAFFQMLVECLGEALGATLVHIAEVANGDASTTATVITGWSRDERPETGDYRLTGTPCEHTVRHDLCVIPRQVTEAFPEDTDLVHLDAEAYVGIRLRDSSDRATGLLIAVFDRPLEAPDEARSLMQIFAARAASELERIHGEQRLRLAAAVLENAGEGILVADDDGAILESNPAYRRMTGQAATSIEGAPLLPTLCGGSQPVIARLADALARDGRWEGEIDCQRHDGTQFPAWLSLSRLSRPHVSSASFIALVGDITEIRESQAELHYLAHHDPLTGLPNRIALRERLARALDDKTATNAKVAVLFIDLDGFKDVNDSLGHTEGDRVLGVVARRLETQVGPDDLLARLGGDEFMLLLADNGACERPHAVAADLLDALDVPFEAGGRPIYITASIGIALAPDHGDDAETLIRAADAAMYLAKAEGRNTTRVYQPELTDQAYHRIATAGALRAAIDADRLFLEYQPVMDLTDGTPVAHEALVRWRRQDGRIVPPGEFIPVAEHSGLIVPVSRWVFRTACWQMRAWLDAGNRPPRIAVNVSPAHLQQGDLVADLRAATDEAGIAPHHLIVEVTESLLMQAPGGVLDALEALRAMDVDIAVDDFGTGYSSLAYLKRLPISILKLDKSFTQDLPDDADSAAIARAIMAMAEGLGLRIVAEGIETEAQLGFLRRHGCRFGQGFLFSRPVAAEALPPTNTLQYCWHDGTHPG
ncbi:EAL domain-containing protein [Arhodomonas sp. AD133]|uniref:bifunctional diguanylate cyclase/phosphodiesterase n=1 Tax=Arhodomonas sp. AD133 TaxID=3415009 RepID=UPI003EB9559C